MGAQHSLQYGVTQEDLELVAGPECVADEVWLRLEQATIVAPKKGPRNALDKAAAGWAMRLYTNKGSGNFGGMLHHMLRLLARCTSPDHARLEEGGVKAALNYVILIRTAAKHHIETRDPTLLHTLYAPHMDKVVDGVQLLLMCDQVMCHQVMHAHQPVQTHTYLTYTLRAECVLMLVVLTSTQLTHPQRDATGVVNIFLECLMQRAGGQRGSLLRALLGHYMDMHHEPPERSPTFGEALSEALFSASPSFSMSSQSLQAWQHGRAVACSSSVSSRGCVLSERCALLLLVLVNYTHSNAASKEAVECNSNASNGYRAALRGMHDSDGRTSSASPCNETIVCYKALHDGLAIGLAHYRDLAIAGRGGHPGCGGSVMLLYMVMTSSQSFRNMVLAKSEVHQLLEPLLAILYHHTAPATQATPHRPQAPPVASASCYVLLLVLLMLSQDGSYCARLHGHECTLSSVAWYKERHLTKVSLGSLAIIVLMRSAQHNMGQQDGSIARNSLAVACNMSPHMTSLHPYAAQRMVQLYEVLSKRCLALHIRQLATHPWTHGLREVSTGVSTEKRLSPSSALNHLDIGQGVETLDIGQGVETGHHQGGGSLPESHLPDAAVQSDRSTTDTSTTREQQEREEALSLCKELRLTTVHHLIAQALTHGATRNPHLIYALIYKRSVFDEHAHKPASRCTPLPSPLDTHDNHTLLEHMQKENAESAKEEYAEGAKEEDASMIRGPAYYDYQGSGLVEDLSSADDLNSSLVPADDLNSTLMLDDGYEASTLKSLHFIHSVTDFFMAHMEASRACREGQHASSSHQTATSSHPSSSPYSSVDKV